MKLSKFSLQKKLIFSLGLVLLLFLVLFVWIELTQINSLRHKKSILELENLLDGAYSSLESSIQIGDNARKYALTLADSMIADRAILDFRMPLDIIVINQVSKQEHRVRIPSMNVDGKRVYGSRELVDKFSKYADAAITVFQLIPQGLLRIATSIDGDVATFIPQASPVYQSVVADKSYQQRSASYISEYRPFKSSAGEIIGAIYIETSGSDRLKSLIDEDVGNNGYLFIVDSRSKFKLHPGLEGKEYTGKIEASDGVFNGLFPDRDGNEVESIIALKHNESTGWIVGAAMPYGRFSVDIGRSQVLLIVGVIIALIFFIIMFKVLSAQMFGTIRTSVSSSIGSVIEQADTIGDGNQELLSRIREQSVALDKSTSTISEITSTVGQTSEHAQNAYNLSTKASDSANDGSGLSIQVQAAMDTIISSSSKIKEIVSLVEDIAFQTNILAINAAIEAAHAGDQGKGFAVVAIEVRDLASRSADAAKEIKGLISESLTNVENGSVLVKGSSDRLQEIADQISEVTALTKEITVASEHEHQELQEVAKIIEAMDVNIHQNAAIADTASKSSGVMQERVDKLKILIEQHLRWK